MDGKQMGKVDFNPRSPAGSDIYYFLDIQFH